MEREIFYIDLFSGAGGTTTGVHLAGEKVIACVNHDKNAIASHKANHPECLHFIEDVRDYKVIIALKHIVNKLRKEYPDCIIIIWASLECTNFSKAKGGLPREADSRTLAYTLYNYIDELNPDLVQIENVREFMAWGPLDEKGRPVSRTAGSDYIRWIQTIKSFGYTYDHRILNAANYGAYTSRERFFAQFSKDITIKWPEPTHSKNPSKIDLFSKPLKKWNAVREVLDLEDEGRSIFDRKKPLVDATLKRIYAGVEKFAANGYFLTSYYGNGSAHSTDEPNPTVTTKDRFSLVQPKFIDQQYGASKPIGLDMPINTLTANPKFNLVSTQWLLNPQFKNTGNSIDKPCFTLIARMDKRPPYLMSAVIGMEKVQIKEDDSKMMVSLKKLCQKLSISDIKMRMLKILELLQIQGFPINYKLIGTQADQKKFIGNAVEVNMSKAIATTTRFSIDEYLSNIKLQTA